MFQQNISEAIFFLHSPATGMVCCVQTATAQQYLITIQSIIYHTFKHLNRVKYGKEVEQKIFLFAFKAGLGHPLFF